MHVHPHAVSILVKAAAAGAFGRRLQACDRVQFKKLVRCLTLSSDSSTVPLVFCHYNSRLVMQ